MRSQTEALLQRITQVAGHCGGRPCIRGLRVRVADVLELLAAAVPEAEVLQDFPDLEPDDFRACLLFAARRAAHVQVAA
jgi:uncharacterized protein (DUF433 family)